MGGERIVCSVSGRKFTFVAVPDLDGPRAIVAGKYVFVTETGDEAADRSTADLALRAHASHGLSE